MSIEQEKETEDKIDNINKKLDSDLNIPIEKIVANEVRKIISGREEEISNHILCILKGCKEKFVVVDEYETLIHALYRKSLTEIKRIKSNSQVVVKENEREFLISVIFDFTPRHKNRSIAYKRLKDMGSKVFEIYEIEDVDRIFFDFERYL